MSGFHVAAILLAIAAVFSVVNERLVRLPATIGLFLLALVSAVLVTVCIALAPSASHDVMIGFEKSLQFDHVLIDGMLSFLLFAGALHIPLRSLEEQRWPILGLAVVSTLLNTALVGSATWGIFRLFGGDLTLVHALLFGALISPTDPIAALAILSKVGLPKRLETLFSGESLFNDGVGVVVFSIFKGLAVGTGAADGGEVEASHGVLRLIVQEIGGGIAGGLILGALADLMIRMTKERSTHILVTVAMVGSGYAACAALNVSGPIAMVIGGLIVGNRTLVKEVTKTERHEAHVFWSMVDDLLNAMLFVMLGLVYLNVPVGIEMVWAAPAAIVVCIASRYVSVWLTMAFLGLSKAYHLSHGALAKLLTWGSLRGGLSIALALSLDAGRERDLILGMTAAVVAFSLLVQGLSVGKLYRRLMDE